MSLLEISDLEAGYETGQVVFGVDFEVNAGETVSLLGTNGAGKTTTFRAIAGASPPTVLGGSITFAGDELSNKQSYKIANRGLSLVPEKRRCFPRLTVEENIRMAIDQASNPKPMEQLFSWFPELEEFRANNARNLSGGQQQMLTIARGLATNPELLLLDEPSEGLAPSIVKRIKEIIEQINEEQGITVFMIEQNIALAMAVADRHYIMSKGQIIETVTTEELRNNESLIDTYLSVGTNDA